MISLPRLRFVDLAPPPADFCGEVMAGLSLPNKALPPKFFYDKEGCRLFEAICELPEYYLTRAEIEILGRHAGEIAGTLGGGVALIELGSGNSRKVRLLLDRLRPRLYVPLDIARDHLLEAARGLAAEYAWLEVRAVCVDYTRPFDLEFLDGAARRVVFFPGSSIGNFEPHTATDLLRNLAQVIGADGGLLIGFDLRKDGTELQRAYNDRAGVTAEFNINLLRRINRELGADFAPERFRHHAFFNEVKGRIEMHLTSLERQQVRIGGEVFRFAAEESIHTENSYKYSVSGFERLADEAGFVPQRAWYDRERRFCLYYLTVAPS